jgi:hypothetical protein
MQSGTAISRDTAFVYLQIPPKQTKEQMPKPHNPNFTFTLHQTKPNQTKPNHQQTHRGHEVQSSPFPYRLAIFTALATHGRDGG